MDYEALMDGRQKHVHEHFSPNSKLNDPEFVKKLLDWITFWRRNPSRFVQRYFGITLYLYQHIILYLIDIFPSICIPKPINVEEFSCFRFRATTPSQIRSP